MERGRFPKTQKNESKLDCSGHVLTRLLGENAAGDRGHLITRDTVIFRFSSGIDHTVDKCSLMHRIFRRIFLFSFFLSFLLCDIEPDSSKIYHFLQTKFYDPSELIPRWGNFVQFQYQKLINAVRVSSLI